MIAQCSNLLMKIKPFILAKWYRTAIFYGVLAAAIFLAWLLLDAGGVAFVYSEF